MHILGQLVGMSVMGLLAGLITRSFAKKRHQEKLGKMELISCIVAAFVGGFLGFSWLPAAIIALGFIAYTHGVSELKHLFFLPFECVVTP